MNSYITLVNSNSSLSKKFRVLGTGYGPALEKMGQQRVTVTGKLDNQVGPVVRRWQYVLNVYETDPTSGYGSLANLKTFFEYNDPSGTPTNVVTLQDFDYASPGDEFSVYIIGQLAEKNISPLLEGSSGVFHVPVQMVETEPT